LRKRDILLIQHNKVQRNKRDQSLLLSDVNYAQQTFKTAFY